jgi:hypothetical protein
MKPEHPPFGTSEEWGSPEFHEFTNIFPEFPKTHMNGYAYIIHLDEQLLNEKAIRKLMAGLQYSQTGGKGRSPRANVKFFQQEGGLPIPMTYWVRQCAGMYFHAFFLFLSLV